MKKVFMTSILLSIMALAACGDDSNTSSVEDECTKDPALCEDNTPDTPVEEQFFFYIFCSFPVARRGSLFYICASLSLE